MKQPGGAERDQCETGTDERLAEHSAFIVPTAV